MNNNATKGIVDSVELMITRRVTYRTKKLRSLVVFP